MGRSGILVDTGTERILMDYGVKLEKKPIEYPKPVNGKLDAILVSHTHLDHQGAIPILFNKGQKCPVYGSEINVPLSRMLWFDSLKIAEHEGENPMFSGRDISKTIKNFKPVKYRQPFEVGKTRVTAYDAGHIPGSAMYLLETQGKRILYTSDFNTSDTRMIRGCDMDIPPVDVLIIESTYSDREQPPRQEEERVFINIIKETLANDGLAIIPCFAISRSQEILLILDEYELNYPVYMDGMCQTATKIIQDYPHLQKEYNSLKKALQRQGVTFVDYKMRRRIMKQPCIMITTSGMLTGGPVVHYLKKLHDREECSLLLTGFQIPGTEGEILLQTGRYIHEDLNLKVKMLVKKFSFSSHTQRSELFEFVDKINPRKVFCVHGDHTEDFARELKEKGFDAIAGSIEEVYRL